MDLNLADVWGEVAGELRALRARGFGHLLTEDVVRFAAARALVNAGAEPASLRLEQPHPTLSGSRIDLVVGTDFVVEFKYPREPKEQNAAWTMALGEVLKDFYRLAVLPGNAHRLFVLVESTRLRDYIARSTDRYCMHLDLDHVELHPDAARTLPATASAIIGTELAEHRITAHRTAALDIDANLRLSAYQVDPVEAATDADRRGGGRTGGRGNLGVCATHGILSEVRAFTRTGGSPTRDPRRDRRVDGPLRPTGVRSGRGRPRDASARYRLRRQHDPHDGDEPPVRQCTRPRRRHL